MGVLKNQRHELFAQQIAKGKTGAEAYTLAGYKGDNQNAVMAGASRLLSSVKVKARVQEIKEKAAAQAGVTIERVVAELARIGFCDIRKAVEWQGNLVTIEEDDAEGKTVKFISNNKVRLIDSDKLDQDTAAAIAGIQQDATGGVKIRFHDKRAALVNLGDYLGAFKKRVELTGEGGGPLSVEIRRYSDAEDQSAA